MENKCRIKIFSECNGKLAFVRLIKNITGNGLRESKDIVDIICDTPYKYVEFILPHGYTAVDFKRDLDTLDWKSDISHENFAINGDVQWKRNFKLLQLGSANKDDYGDFILECVSLNFGNADEMLKFALNKLSHEDLVKTINKFKFNV